MTTQVEVKESNKSIWSYVLVILIAIFLISAAIWAFSPERTASASNQPALMASAARYQGLANDFAKKEARLEQNWSATAARYQAMADADLSVQFNGNEAGWLASASRYQGLVNDYAKKEARLEQNWSATAARYQAMADAYLSEQSNGIEAGWLASAARYQGLANDFAKDKAQLGK